MAGITGLTGWLGVVLGSPEPQRLAEFYRDLMGWPISGGDGKTWITMLMRDAEGVPTRSNLAFQLEQVHQRPVWPGLEGAQQMQFHLDVGVRELGPAVDEALALGASLAEFQPQDDVRVLIDPDGHPFCLYLDEG
ncbi:VOC family protein [Aestuariimicrobium ganziense]|uniref:VOC family protein n=1 Tax=Aestuariimicrobium ganziense TaxID=2773677 RepID=UPI001945A8FA|nr:VOC family protein [Aestuariimicrobium ganziense]